MQVSVEVTPEVSKFIETSTKSDKAKSVTEFLTDKLRTEYDEEQRAKKALATFLEPAVKAAKNGEVLEVTIEDIVREAFKVTNAGRQ